MVILLPLAASLLFVVALLFMKRAADLGVDFWRTTFVSNLVAAVAFSAMWLQGGSFPGVGALWQPALVALCFCSGQGIMFLSINKGDVSIATPVLGTKILIVAGLQSLLTSDPVTPMLWVAAGLAFGAVALLNTSGGGKHHHVGFTIVTAFLSGTSYALFDVLVQRWSPAWGPGRFLPAVFAFVALFSLVMPFLSRVPRRSITRDAWRMTWLGSLCMAAQALCIVSAIAFYGQATRANVILSTRGLWSVIAVWLIGHWFHNLERNLPPKLLRLRLAGATLLFGAVVLALI